MDTKVNTDEAITMNKLEKWVIEWEESPFNTSGKYEEKYPLRYAPMPDDLEVIDNRMIKNHKFYWQKSVYDLERAVEQLQSLNDKQRANIYSYAGKYLALAKKELSESDYELFKEEIFRWIVAMPRHKNTEVFGLKYIPTLNEDNLGISTNTDSFSLRLAYLNSLRRAWTETVEKTGIAKKAIHCKNNNLPFVYAPNRAGRHVVETDEYGTSRTYAYPLWSSEGVDENILEKLKKNNFDINKLAAERAAKDRSGEGKSKESNAFVMRIAKQFPDAGYNDIKKIVTENEKCPEELKDAAYNTIAGMVKHFDSKAGNERTK